VRLLPLFLIGCSSAPPAKPVERPAPPSVSDAERFPVTYPVLKQAEHEPDAARAIALARSALRQLDEERDLGATDVAAYGRVKTRARVVIDHALITQGKPIEVLADLAQEPLACPAAPQLAHAGCEELMSAVATALPNAVSGRGQIVEIERAVLDENASVDAMAAFAKKVGAQVGTVVQRVHVTSKAKDTLEIAARLRFRVSAADANRVKVATGEVVWIAFDARSLKQIRTLWDAGKAYVLRVDPSNLAVQ